MASNASPLRYYSRPLFPMTKHAFFLATLLLACAHAVFAAGETPPVSNLPELARRQIGVTTIYDPSYAVISYPMGDVPADRGVCTDVIIRAFRARGLDLQRAVHEDMARHFNAYPRLWGLKKPDRNIDHRRVPNLMTWFSRQGWKLPVTKEAADYLPGDIVTCLVGGTLPHIMIVSDRKTETGEPLVIHNIGSGTQEEAVLFAFPLTGHYRPK